MALLLPSHYMLLYLLFLNPKPRPPSLPIRLYSLYVLGTGWRLLTSSAEQVRRREVVGLESIAHGIPYHICAASYTQRLLSSTHTLQENAFQTFLPLFGVRQDQLPGDGGHQFFTKLLQRNVSIYLPSKCITGNCRYTGNLVINRYAGNCRGTGNCR